MSLLSRLSVWVKGVKLNAKNANSVEGKEFNKLRTGYKNNL